jgi:ferredoxin-NADP reductase
MNSEKATLIYTKELSPTVKLLRFSLINPVSPLPGQYVTIRKETDDGSIVERDYSICSTPKSNYFEIAVKRLENGELSPYLHQLKVHESISFRGPLGSHFIISLESPMILLSGGVGIAPFMSVLKQTSYHVAKIALVASFRTKDEFLFQEEIKSLPSSVSQYVTITREVVTGFREQRIDENLIQEVMKNDAFKQPKVYICGGSSFVEAMREICRKIGISDEKILYEYFG